MRFSSPLKSSPISFYPLFVMIICVLSIFSQLRSEEKEIPDFIKFKKIADDELVKKPEGTFFTGFPLIASDPLTGNGLGMKTNIFWNGEKDDPFFEYIPYLAKLTVGFNYFETNAKELSASLDIPYFNSSRWRLRIDGKLQEDPTNLYFGITQKTLENLSLPSDVNASNSFSSYKEYDRNRIFLRPGVEGEFPYVTDVYSNLFKENNYLINPKTDYAFRDGKWRIMAGYEIQKLSYSTFTGKNGSSIEPNTGIQLKVPNGQSLLAKDAEDGKIIGIDGGWISIFQTALIYDTRDFEPDPTRGIYFEIANEYSSRAIGSTYNFDKLFFQFRYYYKLPFTKRTVLAFRSGLGNIFGRNAPFFEYQDQWSPDGSINALGGRQSLRGYRPNRFLARSMTFSNFEIRHRIVDFQIGKQDFGLGVAGFLDTGTVRDEYKKLSNEKWRNSYGFGLRLAWNLSTIISLDFGYSNEDRLMYLGMNQIF